MRFQPDTWLEALLRPIAMALPRANVYVEIMAPDLRFVFVLALLVVLAGTALLGRRNSATSADGGSAPRRSVAVLTAALAVAFVPWLATTGNGRYFIAGLLLVGPVCIGLVRLLPGTRGLRVTLAAVMVALQAFVVQQAVPWQAWTMLSWKEPPYFQVDVPREAREQPASYVTMSAISYSLVAPMFHPQSRWMSLHNAPAPGSGVPDARRTEAFLAAAQPGRLMLLVPVVDGMLTPDRTPDARVSEAISSQLAPYRLAFSQPQSCRFLASRALAEMGLGEKTPRQRSNAGFWLCHLTRIQPAAGSEVSSRTRHDAVFNLLEMQCPRLFPSGGDRGSVRLTNGELRSYLQAEMKAYVYDSGDVYYKYYRALNPVRVGSVDDLLAGRARVDCHSIRGRSVWPWDREL